MTDDDFRKMQKLAEDVGGSIRTTYEYDSEGRLASQETQSGRLGERHVVYRYDDHGSVVEQLERNTGRQIGLDADGNQQVIPEPTLIREIRSDYTYDAHDNWTECTRTSRFAEDGAFQPANAEWRTIEYFELA
jgi:YD repeat-containing protein